MSNAPRDPFFPADESILAAGGTPATTNLGRMDYLEALRRQEQAVDRRIKGEAEDQYLVVEHPCIYTAGKRTQQEDMPDNDVPVIDINRGGRITWHGEGQLVVYPIVKLADPVDVVDFVRRLEEALIATAVDLGVTTAGRIDGRSGVWVPADGQRPDRKLAAIGIHISRAVTSHGIALNCNNTLEYYDHILPCGITDAGVTTLSEELGREVTIEEAAGPFLTRLTEALQGRLKVSERTFRTMPNPDKGLGKRTAPLRGITPGQ